MPKLERGIFIALEGVDGAGSSTQTKILVALLREKGFQAVATKEPNPEGMFEGTIRSLLGSKVSTPALDALLFAADRVDHVERIIKPRLGAGEIVVSDRYLESSVAYQTAQGLAEEWILSINRYVVMPDLTIIMDIDPAISLKRKRTRPERFENIDFLSLVRRRFQERAEKMGYEVVDASMPIESVHRKIVRAVLPLLVSVSKTP